MKQAIIAKYAQYSWYLLLLSWMQGMALLHISLVLCLLCSFKLLPQAWQRLKAYPWLWKLIASWEGLRLISTLMADHPQQAFIGMFDDVRALSFAALALVYLQKPDDLKKAAIATVIGFSLLAWWALIYHLYTQHSLQMSYSVTMGTLAHVNYAAAYSSIVLLSLLIGLILLPWKKAVWLLIGIVPLMILQLPFGSRTTMLVSVLLLLGLLLLMRQWKGLLLITMVASIMMLGISQFPAWKSQLSVLTNTAAKHDLTASPSLQVRWEIFQVLAHLSLQHPFGLGPRGHGYVDLNAERDYLREHFTTTARLAYHLDPHSPEFDRFDFNHPNGRAHPATYDPHSQYACTMAETGPLGILLLLCLYAAMLKLAWPLRHRHAKLEERLCGFSAIILIGIFSLSGFTVILFAQTGSIMFYTVLAALLSLHQWRKHEPIKQSK